MKKLFTTLALAFTLMAVSPSLVGTEVTEASPERITLASDTSKAAGDYVLVKSASDLKAGSKVVITASGYNYAVSATQSSYNRYKVAVTKKTSGSTSTVAVTSSVGVFTLKSGSTTGSYSFYDENYSGYLAAASSYYNDLVTSSTLNGNSSFSISVSTSGVASITAKGSYTHNKLKYSSSYGYFGCYKSGQKDVAIYQQVAGSSSDDNTDTSVKVTGVSLSTSSVSLTVGETKTLTATVSPSNATNKTVTWTSSNTSVVTVSNGKLTAVKAGSATITVTTADGGYKAAATVTVANAVSPDPEEPVSNEKASWTIMLYVCGADLESQNGLATSDFKEILSVANQPEDVNIIIQTGGAKSWKSTYGINASYTQRYHVKNKQLVLDKSLTKANMGLTSTFQSFLEWGLTEYPAEKTGVIMWNHGGAMRGVCYDENYSSDSLLNSEVNTALSNAFQSTGRTDKLEFIGYDACLMNVQDVAEFNSEYFNYMIASEESESGYGWDYDTWVDDLYAKKSTTTILKAIVDGFITDNGGVSSSSNNQTLSYLNLAYMDAYKVAWENMAKALSSKITSSNKSSFNSLVKSCKYYASTNYTYYGIFDAKDFTNKLASNSTFNPGTTYTNAVQTAFSNLVAYSSCGKGAGNSYGMCMFYSISSNCAKSTYYSATQTNFTNWRSLVQSYGA